MSFFNFGRWFGMGEDKWLIDIPISWEEGDTWKQFFREGGEVFRDAAYQYADGGSTAANGKYMRGPSHESGGIPIEVEGGEWIISKKSVDYWGSDLFRALNDKELPQFKGGEQTDSAGGYAQKTVASRLNPFGLKADISTSQILSGAAETLWNRLFGEKWVKAGFELAPDPWAGVTSNLFKSGGGVPDLSYAKGVDPLRPQFPGGARIGETSSSVKSRFLGVDVNREGNDALGYISAKIGLDLPSMEKYSYFKYDPPPWADNPITTILGGLLGQQGGHVDPMVVSLLTELVTAVREGQDTEVNVFTDMRGESRAAVTDFRSEMRERDLRGLRTA